MSRPPTIQVDEDLALDEVVAHDAYVHLERTGGDEGDSWWIRIRAGGKMIDVTLTSECDIEATVDAEDDEHATETEPGIPHGYTLTPDLPRYAEHGMVTPQAEGLGSLMPRDEALKAIEHHRTMVGADLDILASELRRNGIDVASRTSPDGLADAILDFVEAPVRIDCAHCGHEHDECRVDWCPLCERMRLFTAAPWMDQLAALAPDGSDAIGPWVLDDVKRAVAWREWATKHVGRVMTGDVDKNDAMQREALDRRTGRAVDLCHEAANLFHLFVGKDGYEEVERWMVRWGRHESDDAPSRRDQWMRAVLECLDWLETREPNDGSGVDLRIGDDGLMRASCITAEEYAHKADTGEWPSSSGEDSDA